jgi:hypothetical protein
MPSFGTNMPFFGTSSPFYGILSFYRLHLAVFGHFLCLICAHLLSYELADFGQSRGSCPSDVLSHFFSDLDNAGEGIRFRPLGTRSRGTSKRLLRYSSLTLSLLVAFLFLLSRLSPLCPPRSLSLINLRVQSIKDTLNLKTASHV